MYASPKGILQKRSVMDSIWNDEREEIIQALRRSKGNMTKDCPISRY